MKASMSRSDLAIKLAVCLAMIASLFGCGPVRSLTPRSPHAASHGSTHDSESVFHRPVL
jgi:hypothetical protein